MFYYLNIKFKNELVGMCKKKKNLDNYFVLIIKTFYDILVKICFNITLLIV